LGFSIYFLNTAGDLVSCIATIAIIDVIEENNLINNTIVQGNYIINRFKSLVKSY